MKVVECFIFNYEVHQANFIGRFYSRMKLNTLKDLVGSRYKDENLVNYINKNGWTKEGDIVTLKEVPIKPDISNFKKNLEFINSMTVYLENNVKANNTLSSLI